MVDRDALREHLVSTRIAGEVATSRQNNLRNIELMLEHHPNYTFGLELDSAWTFEKVLALLADVVGISPDAAFAAGVDTIDPDRTLAGLDRARDRLARAAAREERVVVATGHPAGILAIHLGVAAALTASGATLLNPASGSPYRTHRGEHRELRYLGGVAMVSNRGDLNHTHSPRGMQAILAALADDGQPPPDLVVGDHGWSGAAGQAGIDTIGFADCNDPALFLGEAQGQIAVAVPLDDNVLPYLYGPVTAYLTAVLR